MICFNPPMSPSDSGYVHEALEKLEFYCAIDFFLSETAQHADVVLAGSRQEKEDGAVCTGEGRVVKINKAVKPPGNTRGDSRILIDLARSLGKQKYFSFTSTFDIIEELRVASKGGTADCSGIVWEHLETEMGHFWPVFSEDHPGTPRFFEGGHRRRSSTRRGEKPSGFAENSRRRRCPGRGRARGRGTTWRWFCRRWETRPLRRCRTGSGWRAGRSSRRAELFGGELVHEGLQIGVLEDFGARGRGENARGVREEIADLNGARGRGERAGRGFDANALEFGQVVGDGLVERDAAFPSVAPHHLQDRRLRCRPPDTHYALRSGRRAQRSNSIGSISSSVGSAYSREREDGVNPNSRASLFTISIAEFAMLINGFCCT